MIGPEVQWLLPSLKRLSWVWGRGRWESLLRSLEYERLAQLNLHGLVLDFGGGSRTNYTDRVASWGSSFRYESVNIDPVTGPTYLIQPDASLPITSGRYDAVLALNTLEHVYALNPAIREMTRVLKPGGRLVLIVPFIFRVHGHPNDYHRGTPSFWNNVLTSHNLTDIQCEALFWGPFSTSQAVSGTPGPFKRIRRASSLLLDTLYAARHRTGSSRIRLPQDDPRVASPLGYFVEAKKAVTVEHSPH